MNLTTLERQAEQLWQRLLNAQAHARARADYNVARRIEAISERAFWRLVRRLALGRAARESGRQPRSRVAGAARS